MPIDVSRIKKTSPPFTADGPRFNKVEVYLTDKECEWLHLLASYLDRSMSATLRQALFRLIEEHREALYEE